MNNFTISEFCIKPVFHDGEYTVPLHVANKIIKHHINAIQQIRDKLGFPIYISGKSGYRPVWYEKENGRSGMSQHCFKGKGAADYTCRGHYNIKLLLRELRSSSYTRVCYYPGKHFIHCDYKSDDKQFFIAQNGHEWVYHG